MVLFVLQQGPFCSETCSYGLVRFVLECGPFCPKTWSVLSCNVVRFVWSVLSMVCHVRVPTKRREILIFPRTVGNTGNSRELLGNKLLTKKLLIFLLTAIQLYLQCKNNHYNSTFYHIIK